MLCKVWQLSCLQHYTCPILYQYNTIPFLPHTIQYYNFLFPFPLASLIYSPCPPHSKYGNCLVYNTIQYIQYYTILAPYCTILYFSFPFSLGLPNILSMPSSQQVWQLSCLQYHTIQYNTFPFSPVLPNYSPPCPPPHSPAASCPFGKKVESKKIWNSQEMEGSDLCT